MTGPLVRHSLSIEVTVSHQTEDGADLAARWHRNGRSWPSERRGAQ